MRRFAYRRFLCIVIMGVFVAWWAPFLYAMESTSTSFSNQDTLIGDFGGSASSTNYTSTVSGAQVSPGEASSTSFILRSGILYFGTFAPRSGSWRFYSDVTNETPTTALAAENVAPVNVDNLQKIKLRITIKETGGYTGSAIKYKVQYSESSDFLSGVATAVQQSDCGVYSTWCYADGGGVDNATVTTKTLSDADACSSSVGVGCGTHNESGTSTTSYNHPQQAFAEHEFTLKNSGARFNVTYFFRVFDVTSNKAVPLATGATYPSLSTGGTTLTLTVGGLNSGVTTEGVTTTATTSAIAVLFGTLPTDTSVKAAQRLTVTTNAPQGYQLFVYQTQGLLGRIGNQIDPVSGTNTAPSAWSLAGAAAGAYGYHAGDDALSGGTTNRFATDNTYAQFETIAREIGYTGYTGTAIENEVNDIVYRVEVTNQQQSDIYSSSVGYIIVPTF